ncbi:hypothetical protein KY290_013581 [Solanum tuberosum]|uniref:Integrase catalytic domain-containing protein n=1 Tax=Solanum tuberosum TaxID=4113 RepID=A0ABQ7VM49_SOLTU|nr:hypothetical protein KY289_013708 [Solanum tuberosum]KAH0717027.1 hypothetical protein KY285_013058 [Solanum tuberosum]KAH0769600.1 hypothetical protein KY290_013581 [Solanum tuberosum]
MQIWHNRTSSGHSGMENTYRKISQLLYWKNLRDDINQYVRNCFVCKRSKYDVAASPGLIQPLAIPTSAWSNISMDFIEGLPKSKGKTTIMVVVDRLTKSSHFIALSHPYTDATVAQAFLDQVFKLHGMPENIVSDRDPIFISRFWQELFSAHGATLSTSTAYHPQTDGQTEVLSRTLESYLRCYCSDSQKDWSLYLPMAEWWYNTNSTLLSKPLHMKHYMGNPHPYIYPTWLVTIDEEVDRSLVTRELKIQLLRFHLHRAQQRMQSLANKGRSDGQLQLKLCHKAPAQFTHLPIVDSASPYCEEPRCILERRMIKKGNKAVAQLLIHWKNMSKEQATWEDFHVIKTRFPSFFLEDKEVSKEGVVMRIEVEESPSKEMEVVERCTLGLLSGT